MRPNLAAIKTTLFGGAPSTLRGMGFMLAATLFGAAMNGCIRFLTAEVHPFEIAFFRSLFGFLVLAPVFLKWGLDPLITRRWRLHTLRGGANAASMLLFYVGVSLTPLATVAALNFTSPLFITALAFLVLGEAVRVRRIAALMVGFAGTAIVLRPGLVEVDPGAIYILGSAVIGALTMIIIKVLVRTESSLIITLYTGIVAVPLTFVAALTVWQAPSPAQLAWFAAIGTLGTLNQLSTAQALKEADITAVLPVGFTRLIWASVIGYVAFAEVPDIWTWVGGAVIFSAVIYIAYRERRVQAE